VVRDILWGKLGLGQRFCWQTPVLRSPLATYWVLRDLARLGLPRSPRCAGCRRRPAQWPKFRLPSRHSREAAEERRWYFESKAGGLLLSPLPVPVRRRGCGHAGENAVVA
jgi:hypothetical protein